MKKNIKTRIADAFIYGLLLLSSFICLFPFIYVFNNSISDPVYVIGRQIYFIPRGVNLDAYEVIFRSPSLYVSYGNTILYTVIGTLLGTIVTLMCAYPLSRPRLMGKRFLTMLFLITMYFSGGMVPMFIWINNYGMYNTRWAILLPAAFSCYNMIVARTHFAAIPEEIVESAVVEGANDYQIFFGIILRISTPVIAVIALYNAVYMWNVYFNAILYLSSPELHPLQVYLNRLLSTSNMGNVSGITATGMSYDSSLIMEQVRYPAIIVTILPIIMVYPFVQRYFIKGIMLGSVKG